jgi:poly(beta-D-mannuronate) lyase
LGEKKAIGHTELIFNNADAYQYKIEVKDSLNGTYSQIVDRSSNTKAGSMAEPLVDNYINANAQFVKLTVLGAST